MTLYSPITKDLRRQYLLFPLFSDIYHFFFVLFIIYCLLFAVVYYQAAARGPIASL